MKSFMKFLMPIVLIVFAIGVYAQPEPGMGMGKRKAMIHEKLNLTADQEKKIEDLRTAHQKKMIDLRADMQKLHLEKKELLSKGNYDRKAFLALEDKIMNQRNTIETSMANHQMDVYELLDANQKVIWNKRPAFNKQGRMGKMGRGMRRHMDCPNGCDGMGPRQGGNGFHGGM
ncbi:MAG: Spy/CpxP family protein refolding chaperone [Ignavibacteriaceae bacterium]